MLIFFPLPHCAIKFEYTTIYLSLLIFYNSLIQLAKVNFLVLLNQNYHNFVTSLTNYFCLYLDKGFVQLNCRCWYPVIKIVITLNHFSCQQRGRVLLYSIWVPDFFFVCLFLHPRQSFPSFSSSQSLTNPIHSVLTVSLQIQANLPRISVSHGYIKLH